MNRRLLATYLNDHLAAAVGAVQLARRTAGSNRGTPYGEALTVLATEIEEDRDALAEIMRRLGVRWDHAKVAVAWSAEKLGRLKLNGQLTGYSPLSRLEEIEILQLGVHGKLLLWQALRRAASASVSAAELDGLIERARSQHRRLGRQRLAAVTEALGGGGAPEMAPDDSP
jgi:hypothetical protein